MPNTREVALLIWAGIFLIYALSMKKIRHSLFEIIISCKNLLIHPLGIMVAVYVCLVFCISYLTGIIGTSLIKDYFVWIAFGLTPMIGKVVSNSEITIRETVFSMFKFSIIPLFIINEYRFSLWVELLIVPLAAFLTMLLVVSENDPQYSQVTKVLKYIIGIMSVIIIYYSLKVFASNINHVKQLEFWEKMFIDIIGIALHFPLLFIIQLFCCYEQIIIRTNLGSKKDKLIAGFTLFKKYSWQKEQLINLVRQFNLRRVYTVDELSRLINDAKASDR